MQQFRLILFGLFILICFHGNTQTTLHLQSIPASTPADESLYLAGNINNWNPGHEAYCFKKDRHKQYWLTLDSISYALEFKITRGSWNTVEASTDGSFFANRSCTLARNDTLHMSVLSWDDLDGKQQHSQASTANSQVTVLDTHMYMPQLNRYRRIWIYLPQAYQTSSKPYPVLYLLDGQNVFDATTAYAGEWKVDETLHNIEENGKKTAIIVAIDNGGEHRANEYSPYIHEEYGGGEGSAFLEFIVKTLKPHIDQSFRTKPNAENTGIMGSSLGGLFAHYAHLQYPQTFGKVGMFSPSFWFSEKCFTNTVQNGNSEDNARLYMVSGLQEIDSCQLASKMYNTLTSIGYNHRQVIKKCSPDGEHAEWFWAREFEEAFLWLFYTNVAPHENGN